MTTATTAPSTLVRTCFIQGSQSTWQSLLRSRSFLLVHVALTDVYQAVEQVVHDYFQAEYPGQFSFVKLTSSSVILDEWWRKNFGATRPLMSARGETKTGFYLFHLGGRVGFCSDKFEASLDEIGQAMLLGLVEVAFSSRRARPSELTIKHANSIINSTEASIRRLNESPATSANTAADDSYLIIGVPRGQPADAYHRARKELIRKNHPDQVAHLDPEIRMVAERRTLAVNSAYELILEELKAKP